jgi:hypothetical protein
MVFPLLMVLSMGVQMVGEIKTKNQNVLVDVLCFAIITVSVVLYLFGLHGKPKVGGRIRAYFKRTVG